jgi:hypothetical protein
MSGLLRLQDSGNRGNLPAPFPRFATEPLSSLFCQNVVLCRPAVLGGFPFASNQSCSLQALERHKQRTRIHMEHTLALICSMRIATPYPCTGSSASVFKMSMSKVPCTRSLGLSGMKTLPLDQELDEELRPYLDMAIEEKMKQGMSREDAARSVRLERGSLGVAKETVRAAGWESSRPAGKTCASACGCYSRIQASPQWPF